MGKNAMFDDISNANYEIGKLVNDKNRVLNNISEKMAYNACSKATLTDEQIEMFREFNGDCVEKTKRVDKDLAEIKEFMVNGSLKETRVRQSDAMSTLRRIIEHGERTLSFI